VRIEFADGRAAAGTVIGEQGEILTAGHAVIGPGRECRVLFWDGSSASARTQGVSREFDVGLVRIEPEGRYRPLDAHGPAELPQNQPYLALVNGEPQVAQLRRVLRSTVWTDLEPPGWIAGGPLLDASGRLIAVQVARSKFGGVLGTRLNEAWQQLPRLRGGEVFGAWPVGREPLTGFEAAVKDAVVQLTAVAAGGPADKAGLRVGDLLRQAGVRPIAIADDLQHELAERDAGHEVAIEFTRGGQPRQTRLTLAPRTP
jgi:S1-C subfamily serine protease